MLSLDRLEAGPATTLQGAWAPGPTTARASETTPPPNVTTPPEPSAPTLTERREATLRQVTPPATHSQPPGWSLAVMPIARPAGPTVTAQSLEPLFPRTHTRGLLTAALATWNADGPLDIARIVDMLSRLEPLRDLPFEMNATVRRGVQVLVDTSIGMGPYRLDVEEMIRQIASIVADDQMQLRYFSHCPSRGCAALGEDALRRWQAPARGTPVFLLTDLGIGAAPGTDERAGVAEWLEFAEQVSTAGSGLTALVPYGPRRWPRELARALRIIHWDRRTTAAVVRRSLVTASRVAR
jgi:hypothetical protein